MDYGMIGKIEKAKMYAEERDRIQFKTLHATIRGENDSVHAVSYEQGIWGCDCDFFASRGVCSHTMALERVLANMVDIGIPA